MVEMSFLRFFLLSVFQPSISFPLDATQAELQVETDRLIFDATMAEFMAARDAQQPSILNWTSDSCSDAPDNPFGFNFEPACFRHDFGYRNFKFQGRFDEAGKGAVDRNFKEDMYEQCANESARDVCEATADLYFEAVVLFAKKRAEHGQF